MFTGLFDVQSRFAKIDKNGDPLLAINELVDWELFRPELDKLKEPTDGSPKGRKPIDALLKFKMLVLQSLYNLSDDGLEQQVLDRLSFMRFLGLRIGDDVPDATTIWLFREQLKKAELVEKLFARFGEYLNQSGFDARKGQIVDATIVRVPIAGLLQTVAQFLAQRQCQKRAPDMTTNGLVPFMKHRARFQ